MAESLTFASADRAARYHELLPQLKSLCESERDAVANQANFVAALREAFGFFWAGFYRVDGDTLVLGPFQGPVACTRIAHGKGVCGQAWAKAEVVLVPNVEAFPGHIACSSASRSEIVLPVPDSSGTVRLILDIDSDRLDDFSDVDRDGLQALLKAVGDALTGQ